MIFDIHIIFQPFRSFIHVIYLQNCIIHLQMDPSDQLYTLDELQCWKVENLRQFLTMRSLTKSGTKELAALCFSACKLNLPLVPSNDDVLKDNKRCYDNILSDQMVIRQNLCLKCIFPFQTISLSCH